jgi:hypothetical protein
VEKPDLGAPDIRIHYIRVTNNSDKPYTDRYDGVPVTLEAGRSDNLPLDMAAHMFGYVYGVTEDVMFRHTCKRQGWNTPAHLQIRESGKTLAQELFGQIEIKPVIYKMVEEKPDLDSPIPADPDPAQDIAPLPPRRHKAGAS